MGRRLKYADPADFNKHDGGMPVHHLTLDAARRYDPNHPGNDADGVALSLLTEMCSGDWSWKPGRDKLLGKDMVTFRGVPKGAAELYGPRILS